MNDARTSSAVAFIAGALVGAMGLRWFYHAAYIVLIVVAYVAGKHL